jgi:hypothetical protein
MVVKPIYVVEKLGNDIHATPCIVILLYQLMHT